MIDRSTGRITIADYVRAIDLPKVEQSGKATFGPGYQIPLSCCDTTRCTARGGVGRYEEDDHHHWSVWRTNDFVDLVKALRFNIVEIQDTDDKVGNGFSVVIRK